MNEYIDNLQMVLSAVKINMPLVVSMIAGLWLLHVVNAITGYQLNRSGIYPRNFSGLFGIPFAPLLHADFNHLFFNSIPLFVLANFVLLSGRHQFFCATLIIIFLGGFGLWLLGRKAIHIGASSLIMGYFGLLLMTAYQQHSVVNILVGIVCLYYFGGLLMSVLPGEAKVSWEGHLLGLGAGIVAFYGCPYVLLYMSNS